MARSCSRRAFLAGLPALAAAQQIASEQQKYRDPLTEFELLQLTDPKLSNCYLPAAPLRAVAARSRALVYCSDRSGSLQAYRMDLRDGQSRQLTSANSLTRGTLTLLGDDRSVCYADGDEIWVSPGRSKPLYTVERGWTRGEAFASSEDGQHLIIGEQQGSQSRVRLVSLLKGVIETVAEVQGDPILAAAARPRRAGLLYRRADGLYVVNYDGQQNRKLRTAAGQLVSAVWSSDGRSIFYIAVNGNTHELREHVPDANEDKAVARTTQFISFVRNANASVFAGVSGSLAAPHILILIRAARRELTVAEHKASNPRSVAIQFSPNGQRLFYETDRQGKHAIYSMNLERFLDDTEASASVF